MDYNLLILLVATAQVVGALAWTTARRRWLRLTTNFGLGVVMNRVTALVIAPMLICAAAHPLWHRPAWLSGAVALALDFVLLDATFWFKHWVSHKVPFLWRFHAIHHMDEQLDMSSGLRGHPVDRIYTQALRSGFIMLFAIPAKDFAIAETFAFAYGLFTHMDGIRIPNWLVRTLGRVLVLPPYHVVHHTAHLPFTDTNYSHVFCIWDRLAGTTLVDAPDAAMRRGLDDRIEGGFIHAVLDPFLPRSLRHASRGPRSVLS